MKWRSLDEAAPVEDTRSLRQQFAERKELIAKYVPPEIQAIHARAIAELREQGIASRALSEGAKAPEFVLNDHNGKPVSSAELLHNGRLVICFFRGRWCPFCVGQLEAMNRILPQIQRAQASLIAISPQTVQQSFFMADQHKLSFPLLSDPGNHAARQFGLVYRVPDFQQSVYRRVFINLPFANGDETWELPVPATYLWTATPPCGAPRSTPITPSVPNLPRFSTGSPQMDSESSQGRNSRLRVCLFQFPAYAVQHPIDELHGLGTGKLARDLQRFIDDHGARGSGEAH
jgi:peroxiredoxin